MAAATPSNQAFGNTRSSSDAFALPPSAFTPAAPVAGAATPAPAPIPAPQTSAGDASHTFITETQPDPQTVTVHTIDLSRSNFKDSDLQTADPKVAAKVISPTVSDAQATRPAPANVGAPAAAANTASGSGPVTTDAVPPLSGDVNSGSVVPAGTGGASGIFSDSADNMVSDHATETDKLAPAVSKSSDLGVSNLTAVSTASKSVSAATAASEASSDAKSGHAPQPTAAPATSIVAEKKPAIAGQSTTNVASSSGTVSSSNITQTIPAVIVSGKDAPPALAPLPPAVASPPTEAGSESSPTLPQTHQMLDSAPLAETAAILPNQSDSSSSDAGLAAQVNAQMHVGIRSDAFGSVEVHTVVQQSEIGITVHSDRDIARWFSSEIPGLESGLNNSHLNLTGVSFDSGSSGVQTGSSFQQDQPRQHFSETGGSQPVAQPNPLTSEDSVAASTTVDFLPSDLSVRLGINRVSIHA
jgi:hypothetical protein